MYIVDIYSYIYIYFSFCSGVWRPVVVGGAIPQGSQAVVEVGIAGEQSFIYIYVYAYIYIYTYIYTYVCLFIYIFLYIYTYNIHIHIHIHVHVHVHVHVYIYAYLHICIYTYIRMCMYIYICTASIFSLALRSRRRLCLSLQAILLVQGAPELLQYAGFKTGFRRH